MRLSTLFGRTLREAPTDAEHVAHQLVVRAGLARQLHAGSYALLPLGMRVARRIEAMMHAEMERIGAQEFRTPIVQSAELWQRSGRYTEYGPAILRVNDRTERPLIVAPTHEEAVAELARREMSSYRQMPALVYQIHTKYRDETRAKGGLMRMREFTMLDAYTLTADAAGLDVAYEQMADAFGRIFTRCGVRFVVVEASAGEMGGREPREYMALSANGEDTLTLCDNCGYAANVEVASSSFARTDQRPTTNDQANAAQAPSDGLSSLVVGPLEEVATPHAATIADLAAFLGISAAETAKAVFFDTPERGLVFAVIRGDREVNEDKLRAVAGVSALSPASAEQIAATGAVPGYASPVGLRVDQRPTTNNQQTLINNYSPGVFVIADRSVVEAGGLVAGANKEGYHLRNVVYGRDWHASVVADIALVRDGDPCPRCGAPLRCEQGIEIGHIFKLGTRFTEALGANFLDQNGVAQPIVMGSYGIGVERLMQVIIEQHHDAAGIIWPIEVAPYDVHLVGLGKGAPIRAACDALYAELEAAGLRVLYDDREESAGIKFNDADLLGVPVRIVFNERLEAAGQVEIKRRGGEVAKIARTDLVATVRALCGER